MINYILSGFVALALSLGGWFAISQEKPNFGAFSDGFLSIQLAPDPDDGECLTTDGTDSEWVATCGGGGTGWASSTEATSIRFTGSGNVGIGTSSPYAKLSIVVSADGASNPAMVLYSDGGAQRVFDLRANGDLDINGVLESLGSGTSTFTGGLTANGLSTSKSLTITGGAIIQTNTGTSTLWGLRIGNSTSGADGGLIVHGDITSSYTGVTGLKWDQNAYRLTLTHASDVSTDPIFDIWNNGGSQLNFEVDVSGDAYLHGLLLVNTSATSTFNGGLQVKNFAANGLVAAQRIMATSSSATSLISGTLQVDTSLTVGTTTCGVEFCVDGPMIAHWQHFGCRMPWDDRGQSTAVTTNLNGLCGLSVDSVTDGSIQARTEGRPAFFRLQASTGASIAAGEGVSLTTGGSNLHADGTPYMTGRIRRVNNNSAQIGMLIGFTDRLYDAALNVDHDGAYFIATSTEDNWKIVAQTGGNRTFYDTGVASTSLDFEKFEIYLTDDGAVFKMNDQQVGITLSTTTPTENLRMEAFIVTANGTTGNVGQMDVGWLWGAHNPR